mmetsp:Transcript_4822/g.13951  ORF Transcript_4822/g.13951 Transcript_4822/m.13951 type:complete len:418 (+) Transcript_4822:74-1327(+)
MGKSKKHQLEAYQYDEASSGSDDSDSSDDENDDEYSSMSPSAGRHQKKRIKSDEIGSESDDDEEENSDGDSDDDDDDDDDDSDQGDSESEEDGAPSRRSRGTRENGSVPGDSSDDGSNGYGKDKDVGLAESFSDEEDVPLHERLLKKENRGRKSTFRREQKSRALEEATKRLASFKELKQRKKDQQKNSDGKDQVDKQRQRSTNDGATKPKKKKNKHKPTEVSSKRADFFGRGARRLNESGLGVDIGAHRYKPMDPRLSTLSGHFDEDRFHSNYEFLEEMRNKEIGQVRKRIAAHKATGNKGNRKRRKLGITQADGSHSSTLEEDVARLKSLTQARADLERRKIDRAAKQSVKRKIREDVESGKSGAYYLKRKEKKRLELEARFEEIRKLKGEKGVEKILEKKRKKNKSRDASFLSR